MKSVLTLFLFCISVGVLVAQDTTQVTFQVYMGEVAQFDPSIDVLRVAGDFQEFNPTDSTGANILTDADGDSVYTVTMPVTMDTIRFKYVINNWDGSSDDRSGNEFVEAPADSAQACVESDGQGNFNRKEGINLDSTTVTLPAYFYDSCDELLILLNAVRTLRELRGVSISPNPMNDRAKLSLPAQTVGSYNIRVLGADGRLVSQAQEFTGTSYDIERGNLVAGIYLVEVINSLATERAVLRLSVE